MKACKPLKYQILYGIIGFALLFGGIWMLARGEHLIGLLMLGGALFAHGGCPACWISDVCDSAKAARADKDQTPQA